MDRKQEKSESKRKKFAEGSAECSGSHCEVPSSAKKSIMGYINGPKLKRQQYLTLMREIVEDAKTNKQMYPGFSAVPKKVQPHATIFDHALQLPTTPNTKYIDRDILKRINSPKLEEDFAVELATMMKDVRQEFINVTHKVGVICVIKAPDPSFEGHITLKPYQLPGKTAFHATRLKIIKELQTRLFITFPLIRGILNYCVAELPECLINFGAYRNTLYSITDLQDMFNEEIERAKALIRTWYKNVLSFVRYDKTVIPSNFEYNYFSCGTGLMSVYLSQALRITIEHLIDVTRHEEKMPYLKMSLYYDKKILLEPNIPKICDLFVKLVGKISTMADNLPALEASHSFSFSDKLISIFISQERRKFYEKQIKHNVTKLLAPVIKYVKKINTEFAGAFSGQEEPEKIPVPEEQPASAASDELVKQPDGPDYSFELEAEARRGESREDDIFVIEKDISFEEGYNKVTFYRSYIDKLAVMVDVEYYLIGQVVQSTCRDDIRATLRATIEKIANKLIQQHLWENEDICEQFDTLTLRALATPQTSDELMEMGTYMSWAGTELLPSLKERIDLSLKSITKLVEMTTLSDEHIDLNSRTVNWLDGIKPVLEKNLAMFETCKFEFEERLQKNVETVHGIVKAFFPRLELLDEMDDADHSREYLNHLAQLLIEIREFDKQLAAINKEETTFKFPLTGIPDLKEIKEHLFPFHRLVKICFCWKRNYGAWITGPLKFLDFNAAEAQINEYYNELVNLQKNYRNKIRQSVTENHRIKYKGLVDDPDPSNHPAPIKLCSKTIKEINNFRPSLNMMKIMCNDALLQRHWDEMSEIAGFDMTPNAGTTLKKLMSMSLDSEIDKYEVISSGAIKERQLLQNLEKMQEEWDSILFTISAYKNTEIKILTQLDDVQVILDDHVIKTLSMRSSVFVKPYEVQVKNWYEKITRINAALDELSKVQSQWLHLLPIFSSEDIISQMPEESQLFKKVDKVNRNYMDVVTKERRVIETAGSLELLEDLQDCSKLLERINEGTAAYLERKRLLFPRFFFLSNDEMLEILSETKDPLQFQRHLKKCFAGIARLEFDGNLQIHAMFSEQNEKIEFPSIINTKETKGNVEKWLVQIEKQMIASIHDKIFKSWNNYNVNKLLEWVEMWAAQAVLVVSQMFWTSNTHLALYSKKPDDLNQFLENLENDLTDFVNLVRTRNISNLTRMTIKTLIVLNVHFKDATQELIDKKVQNHTEFKWLAHLRYYWEEDCKVRLINVTVNYAYEYLGNSDRLVVTPLTERCYRTLIGAYQLHVNGSPEGPAGTGKTETIKNLAKALAVYCIVFNCSEGLDYKATGKFFKGLASSGAWVCFDEFDRIQVEVLSVVAQQILSVILAVRANAEHFVFESTELTLNPTCYICITMNPGYPGRSELPVNVKILFRTVAMMVPDYVKITEICLYSYGFKEAKNLAVKIITLYRLCWEQLPAENHYDFGMRAVKSVLWACDDYKRRFADEDEHVILLRSIMNLNIPKFLENDAKLFQSIISDLFPGTVVPSTDYTLLTTAIQESCAKQNLQAKDSFVAKIIQTYEMMLVRHGFMLIGEPFAGKTTTLKVLADTLSILNDQGHSEKKVQYQFINPKSITMGQLFGRFDPVSHEWYDGVVATYYRQFAVDETDDRKWVIFDGPVDTTWAESLNTVLDDNHKLCLMSGEVILIPTAMSTIFEVMDLTQASPATVSRCGMIYTEPTTVGWKPLVDSWITTCNKEWCESHEEQVLDLFDWIVPASLSFIREHCRQLCYPGEINLVRTMMLMIDMVLTDACADISKKEEDQKTILCWIHATFIYAGVCGLAALLDTGSKEKFDEFCRKTWKGQNSNHPYPKTMEKLEVLMPAEGLLCDYVYVYKGKGLWKYLAEVAKTMKVDEEVNLHQVLIPTIDTVKYMGLVEMHIRFNASVLLIGPTGTGKSVYVQDLLMNKLNQDAYEPALVTFTANISANQTQELIISKLNKRKRGHYGPPKEKLCIIFIDDLNMPVKEVYGAQPPIELFRQYFDHGSWYDFKDNTPLYLHEVLLTAAMGPEGGSRQEIYPRFLRHFSIFAINEFSEESVSKIYTSVLLIAYKNNGFPSDVANQIQQIVAATFDVYENSIKILRPTPSKGHYIFNLRDFSQIVMGCAMLKKESADNKTMFAKIWVHEVLRVIYDRLNEAKDRTWLYEKIKACVAEHFNENFDTMCEHINKTGEGEISEQALQKLMFGTYLSRDSNEEDRKYEEITQIAAFREVALKCMEEYNSTHETKLNVVLFKYALEHLSKICRILTMPHGNALLLGISGSGRQSLTKLATTICGHSFFQPNITENYGTKQWHYDIKQVVKEAGGRNKHTVFLFTENQIREERFLQDIDSLLNSGEVPNIFQIDEKQEILELARLDAQGGNRNIDISALAVFYFFIKRTREKLHMVLCFSPVGAAFRMRLRLYPSLVACCTIDWFEAWPEDALEQIAHKMLVDIDLTTEVKESITLASKYFHKSSQAIADDFAAETARKTYVTSSSYLELIRTFTHITSAKQTELMAAKRRFMAGLEKMDFAGDQIAEMQKSLEAYQPQLKEMSEKAMEMMQEIEKETIQVEHASALVRKDEEIANAQAAEAQTLKAECEADLAEAIPILEDAIAALNTLKPTDITLVKSMKNPPDAIKLVMAAVCVIKDIKPDRLPDPSTGRKIIDYWGPSKRILGDIAFLQSLKDFDKDHIKPEIMVKIRKEYLPHKDFKPHVVAKASSAAEGLCKWIIAMDMYDKVAKEVAPKKEKLEKAERAYAATMAVLLEKKEQVTRLEKRLADLNVYLAEATEKQKDLQIRVDICESKLTRAKKLIGGLSGEKERWITSADSLQARYDCLAGDVLVSCGIIAYLGPYPLQWRLRATEDWLKYVQEVNIPVVESYDFIITLSVETNIIEWYNNGLPQDTFSTANAIIQDNSKRWSLLMDPQLQANMWIKRLEKKNDMRVTKFSDSNYMKIIVDCVERGIPVLIESINEHLETPLDPLLLKTTFIREEVLFISLCGKAIPYNSNFKLYLTSKMRNPHYHPEVFNKVTIINFSITTEGLEDQLLGLVVGKERPDLQSEREILMKEKAANKKALADVEEMILKTLSETTGDILENESAIQILDHSKALSIDIVQKQIAAKEAEEKIEFFRMDYKPVATHSAGLYYCIADLPNVDPMYQFSLKWFINLYVSSIETANKSRYLNKRLQYLRDGFTYNLYANVCRGLFEKDKLMFSFLLCANTMLARSAMSEQELALFCATQVNGETSLANPGEDWLTDKSWKELCQLEQLEAFRDFPTSFTENIQIWKDFSDSADPYFFQIPQPWKENLTSFQKLLLIKIIRPEKLKVNISTFVENEMGIKFVTAPSFDISYSFERSSCICPIVFILSTGADPIAIVSQFAQIKGYGDRFRSVSLGQGQGPIAEALIRQGQRDGTWVCLQNCHIADSWLTSLEKLCEGLDSSNTHIQFRLWLTSNSSDRFPASVLHNSVKMTNEPPTGLQQNLLRSYITEPIKDANFIIGCPGNELSFTRMLYGIAFFHAVVQERRIFGSLGWNIPYEFNESDFNISVQQLQMFINDYTENPYDGVSYLTAECNYGGRVTDEWDRRLIVTILKDFFNPELVSNLNYRLSSVGNCYNLPRRAEYVEYVRHIEKMPRVHPPEVFGLHKNARIIRDLQESNILLNSIALTQRKEKLELVEEDIQLKTVMNDIVSKLPSDIDLEAGRTKYPPEYSDSTNTVFVQEMERYSKLLDKIRTSLQTLEKVMEGVVIMTPVFESIRNSLVAGTIPEDWIKVSYPTLKSLPDYISDLSKRVEFLRKWFMGGKPDTFWLPGFFFAQPFLTATLQNYARKNNISIDQLTFDFEISNAETVGQAPDEGVYVYGLFTEGARWDVEKGVLSELLPKIMNNSMPSIWLKPIKVDDYDEAGRYVCPLYQTAQRRGRLSTTGHSNNYVLPILLNTDVEPSHWVKRSAALLCQLNS